MKIAWLVKRYDDSAWELVFEEPDRYHHAVRKIAYAVLEEGPPE